jgi:hypothetical protein
MNLPHPGTQRYEHDGPDVNRNAQFRCRNKSFVAALQQAPNSGPVHFRQQAVIRMRRSQHAPRACARMLAGRVRALGQKPLATGQSPARVYFTRSALSNQVWITSHLSPPFDRKSRRGDRASCSSKKNFRESLPVASPGATRCFLIHWSHSWITKRFACSCFIIARPTSNSRPGHSSNKRFQNSFSR